MKICMHAHEGMSYQTISQQFGLTKQRVGYILKANKDFLTETNDWAKIKRLHTLNRFFNNIPVNLHPTTIDESIKVMEQLRKEIEGDKPTIAVNTTNVIQVYLPKNDEHDASPTIDLEAMVGTSNPVSPEHSV